MGYKHNINKNNEIIENTDDKIYTKKELLNCFSDFISISGFKIVEWVQKDFVPYQVLIKKNDKTYRIVMYLKNVSHCGWRQKPYIKRVQVNNIRNVSPENFIDTETNQTFLILGYYNYDNNPLMVAWNAYMYVMHNTERSCYVDVDVMKRAYIQGYVEDIVSKQKVWAFTPEYFDKFLDNYISKNRIGD